MFKRSEALFKLLCAGAAALLLYQLVTIFIRRDPLARVNIPALPSLPAAGEKDTSSAAAKPATRSGTNAVSDASSGKGTNNAAHGTNSAPPSTVKQGTNAAPQLAAGTGTNGGSNSVAIAAADMPQTNTLSKATNTLAKGTNGPPGGSGSETNVVGGSASGTNTVAKGTNSPPRTGPTKPGPASPGPEMAMGGMPGRMGGPNRGPQTPLPPEIQARVDRIVESEMLAPVMHPMPMALLGIAGQSAFLRAPNGQTGLIKEGEELGGIKLLEIGINRVIVQEEGEKKELTIFNGFGSESLLSKPQDKSPNETTKK
jgi:hypothetical protein